LEVRFDSSRLVSLERTLGVSDLSGLC